MKLTFWEWFNSRILGNRYVVNHSSKEIHVINKKHVNCHLREIKDKSYVSAENVNNLLLNKGYNGCRWCFLEKNTG